MQTLKLFEVIVEEQVEAFNRYFSSVGKNFAQTSEKNMIVSHTIPAVKDDNENFASSDNGVQPMPLNVCRFFRPEKLKRRRLQI